MQSIEKKILKIAKECKFNTCIINKPTGEHSIYLHKQIGNRRKVLYLWKDFGAFKLHTASFYMENEPPATTKDVLVRFNDLDIMPRIFNFGDDEKAFVAKVKALIK